MPPQASPQHALPSCGDAELDALRHWAVNAPIDDFARIWNPWWGEFYFRYADDEVLWRGVDRLAAWGLQHPDQVDADFLGAMVVATQQDERPESGLRTQQGQWKALRAAKLAGSR